MRKTILVLNLFVVCCFGKVAAQCSTCTPAYINTCPVAGGLCNHLDTAYAHNPYDKIIEFYIPQTLTAPAILAQCSCNWVELKHLTVTGVSGLPAGISYLISNNSQFNVSNGDTIGCAHFCGTPLAPGMYTVTVYLSADVIAHGTPIGDVTQNNVPQHYMDTLYVLPDTSGGVSTFTYGNNGSQACDSITINLNALLSAPTPNLTRWFWNIGGQTSQAQNPGSFTFVNHSNVPDTIPVTLTTVLYNYFVTSVHITGIYGGYCGDIEELTCSCLTGADSPDPYLIFPLLGFNNSSNYVSNKCKNVNFTGLPSSATLIPLGLDSVSMQIWDKDNGPPLGSADDLIGTYVLQVSLGQWNYADNNADGYVQFDTVAGTTVTETLNVIVNPSPLKPVVTASQDTFCGGGNIQISLDSASAYSNCTFQWFRDTIYLVSDTGTSFTANTQGAYKVIVTDQSSGCLSTSLTKTVVTVPFPPAQIFIVNTANTEYLNPFPASGFAVNWYYNGSLVAGQNGKTLPNYGPGVYNATVYNIHDSACSVAAIVDTVLSVNRVEGPVYNVGIVPNPNNGLFNLNFYCSESQDLNIALRNTLGQLVYTRKEGGFSGNFNAEIGVTGLSKGLYVLTIESNGNIFSAKVIVQ